MTKFDANDPERDYNIMYIISQKKGQKLIKIKTPKCVDEIIPFMMLFRELPVGARR